MASGMMRFGFAALLCASTAVLAQAPAGVPDGATGQCKDGSYTTAAKKAGACSGHQGVKTWFATVGGATNPDIKGPSRSQKSDAKQAAKSDEVVNPHGSSVSGARANAINKKSGDSVVSTPNNDTKTTMPGPAASGSAGAASSNGNSSTMSSSGSSSSRNTAKGSTSGSLASRQAAPGGGPGMVWVNTTSNTYHCYGTAYYGKTKNGKYESEKDAMNAGAKPDHGKACSQ